jgi:hypothetical protein
VGAWSLCGTLGVAEPAAPALPPIVDSSETVEHSAAALAAKGVKAVIRYYALDKQIGLPTKIITSAERDAIFEAGLALGIAFQYFNNQPSTFNSERGKKDSVKALNYAVDKIKQPSGTAVYFGVDGDWPSRAMQKNVLSYFEAINEEFAAANNPFKVGVYGSGLSCSLVNRAKLASRFWLAKSVNFTGTRDFFNSGRWHMYQNMLEVPAAGVLADTNWMGDYQDLGLFNRTGPITLPKDGQTQSSRRFVCKERTGVFAATTSGAQKIATLRRADNVMVLSEHGDWSEVVVGENSSRFGFCPTAALSPSTAMP